MSTVHAPFVPFNPVTRFESPAAPPDARESQEWYDTQRAIADADDAHRADLNSALLRILAALPNSRPKVTRCISVDAAFTAPPETSVTWCAMLFGVGERTIFGHGDSADAAADEAIGKALEA